MSPNELSPLEVLEKLDAFYTNAWEKLIIYNTVFLALIGIIIPLIIQWWQTRNLKIREEVLKLELNDLFADKSKELEDKILGVIDEKFKTEIEKIEKKVERIKSELRGTQFHLQANILDSDKEKMVSLVFAAEHYIDGEDFANLMTILSMLKESITKITKEDISNMLAEKADLDALIKKLDEMENSGPFVRVVMEIKKLINKIPEKGADLK